MRLIDADALIEFIENRYDITWENDYEGGIKDACVDILEEIYKMPTIEPSPRWIPVTERLPEPRIDVWCNSDLGQMVGYYEENVETWYGRDYLELMVTAWMPLPEPYRGEEQDD